jgi:transcriptional regulator with XRE-family HTH domain
MLRICSEPVAAPKGPFYQQLGKRIAKARRDRKLTQDRLAATIGISRTSVTNIEKGRQLVAVHVLANFAGALGVPAADLIPSSDVAPTVEIPSAIANLNPQARDWAIRVLSTTSENDDKT